MSNKYQHDVPQELKPEFDASRVRVADYSLQRLTHAEKVKTLLSKNKTAVLSSLSSLEEETDTPFGSIINFAVDDTDGDTIFFFASKLAEHTSNLLRDGRASLFVYEEKEGKDGDQLAVARATILGVAERMEGKPEGLVAKFLERHPKANYVHYDDFAIFRFTRVTRVRYIAGFGEMSWIESDEYAVAKSDPVLLGSAYAVKHMNDDHADSNVAIVNQHGGVTGCTEAILVSIDRLGLDFVASIVVPSAEAEAPAKTTKKMVRVMFPKPLESAKEIRDAVVKMSKPKEEDAAVAAAAAAN